MLLFDTCVQVETKKSSKFNLHTWTTKTQTKEKEKKKLLTLYGIS